MPTAVEKKSTSSNREGMPFSDPDEEDLGPPPPIPLFCSHLSNSTPDIHHPNLLVNSDHHLDYPFSPPSTRKKKTKTLPKVPNKKPIGVCLAMNTHSITIVQHSLQLHVSPIQ